MTSTTLPSLTADELRQLAAKVRGPFAAAARGMDIDVDLERDLSAVYLPLAAALERRVRPHQGALVVGVNGAQGAGKSTLCRLLRPVLEKGFERRVAILSIDDLYLTRAARADLARTVHPLFATRGVPGTHDVDLGQELLASLRTLGVGQSLALPAFDKAVDDRLPQKEWPRVDGPLDVVLFEGWCVGAMPQAEAELAAPVNNLEREEDPDQSWRRFVNEQLKGDYRHLFAEIDLLIMLKVPSMESVFEWRGLQERRLAEASGERTGHRIMDAATLRRFIMHYERLTRAMLAEMPRRADLVLEIDKDQRITDVRCRRR